MVFVYREVGLCARNDAVAAKLRGITVLVDKNSGDLIANG